MTDIPVFGKKDTHCSSVEIKKENTRIDKIQIDPTNINIFTLDKHIRDKLKEQILELPNLERDLHNILWIAVNSEEPNDQIITEYRSDILRKSIRDIENGSTLGLYILRSSPILEEFKEIQTRESIRMFGTIKTVDSNHRDIERIRIEFIRVAQEYLDLGNFRQNVTPHICQSCGNRELIISEENDYVCNTCGSIIEQIEESPLFPDTDRINMCARYTYTRKAHFIEAIECFQAKESTDIEPLLNVLREEMRLHHLTKDTLTKEHVYMFLSEQGFSSYYMNVYSIYYTLSGKTPPDIRLYESRLLDDHDRLENIYENVKSSNRTNSLNVHFKLFKLLQKEGYPCKCSDFFILRTKTKHDEHEMIWEQCCKELGWNNS